jgi:hypothetical protein
MKASRRAAVDGSRFGAPATLRSFAVALFAALLTTLSLLGVVALRMARRVVTPAARVPDTHIVDIDVPAQTITLARTPDTELPGRYGLFTHGSTDYLKVGTVLSSDAHTVKRKLLTQVTGASTLASEAAFSGWYYERPDELHLPFTIEHVHAALGTCPAWLFPAATPDDAAAETWVIQIHGRGTTGRSACAPSPSSTGSASPLSWCRTATTVRRRARAPEPTRWARRSGVTSTPPSAGHAATVRAASCSWAGRWAERSPSRSPSAQRIASSSPESSSIRR